jgi:hypothetical protein
MRTRENPLSDLTLSLYAVWGPIPVAAFGVVGSEHDGDDVRLAAPHKDFLDLYEKVSGKGGKCW